MNTINIEPIAKWTKYGWKEATMLKIFNFHDYNFDGHNSSKVHVHLCEQMVVDGGEIIMNPLYAETIELPDEVVQNWGADDQPLIDYVISQLPDVVVVSN